MNSKKTVFALVAVLGIALASGIAWWYQRPSTPSTVGLTSPHTSGGAGSGARPASVEVARVVVMKLTDDTQTVGSLRSRQSVMLRPEVSGRVTQLNFRDGDRVRKGQLLVQLDDQLPLAQVQQSRAELSIAVANHTRNMDLMAQNFISQRSVEESAANVAVAQARLALSQATAARLKIVAPFDGITGIRTVNLGDYLKDGADIVNIEDIDAVYVDFRLPERFQSKVRKGQTANVDLDALPARQFTAHIQAVDPLIDASGRSVGVRGCIDNRQLLLRPGMFARVTAVFGERERTIVVPEEAIVPQAGKVYVIRLKPGSSAETRQSQRVEVRLGIRRPGWVEVLDGLEEGDTVVTAGQQRIQLDGTEVRVMQLSGASSQAAAAPASPASASATQTGAIATGPAPKAVPGPNPCLAGRS